MLIRPGLCTPSRALARGRGRLRLSVLALFVSTVAFWSAACSSDAPTSVEGVDILAAKGGSSGGGGPSGDPTVKSTNPSSAPQDTTLDVRVLGTGFDDGSVARFLLNGSSVPDVRTNSTRFVTSKELVANITIAANAVTDLYDVEVTTFRGKRGVGIELFEVRLKVTVTDLGALPDATWMSAYGVNDGGAVVGWGQSSPSRRRPEWDRAFHWQNGILTDLGPGAAFDISDDGLVVGVADVNTDQARAVVWLGGAGAGWTKVELPTDPGIGGGRGGAYGISDRGDRVVGSLSPYAPDAAVPALWTRTGQGWALTVLPSSGYAHAYPADVNDAGMIIGYVGTAPGLRGVVWTYGGGGWQMILLEALPGGPTAPGGEPESRPSAISETGEIVGVSNDASGVDRAVIWHRVGAGWGSPEIISGGNWGTAWAGDISESGQIVGSATTGGKWGNQIGFLYDSNTGGFTSLTANGSSSAYAINESNQIVGSGFNYGRAVMWTLEPR